LQLICFNGVKEKRKEKITTTTKNTNFYFLSLIKMILGWSGVRAGMMV